MLSMKSNMEENQYESTDDSEVSNNESSQEEEENEESDAEHIEAKQKFDLSKIKERLENGPPSSSDEEESSEAEADDEEAHEESEEEGEKGSGWADAMAKVLNTGKNSESNKPLLLSKAKKDAAKVPSDMEKSMEKPSVRRAKKKEKDEVARKRPDIVKDRMKEKKMARIATRGVVQLFNAVRDQQKTLKAQLSKAGLSTVKRDKVYNNMSKDAFLEVLSGKKRDIGHEGDLSTKKPKMEVKAEEDNDGTWSVLKDNFMMGAKMKDWDKQSDSE